MRIGPVILSGTLLLVLAFTAAAQLVPVWEWTVVPCPALKQGETQEDRARRCGRYEFYQPRDNIRFVSEGKWIDAIIPEFPDLAELQKQVNTLATQNAALEKRVVVLEDKIIPLPVPVKQDYALLEERAEFGLSTPPARPLSMSVHRNGVSQTLGVDYEMTHQGMAVKFFSAPQAGDSVNISYLGSGEWVAMVKQIMTPLLVQEKR